MNYKVTTYLNPQDKKAKAKFYPAPVYSETLTLDEMSELISHSSTLTPADVAGVLKEFALQMKTRLVHGSRIKVDGLGSFKLTFGGIGRERADEVTADDIRKVRFAFLPDSSLRRETLNKVSFSKTNDITNKIDDVQVAEQASA